MDALRLRNIVQKLRLGGSEWPGVAGRVVSAKDSHSNGPCFGFRSDHQLDLFLDSREFKFPPSLVNSGLVCLRPVGWDS